MFKINISNIIYRLLRKGVTEWWLSSVFPLRLFAIQIPNVQILVGGENALKIARKHVSLNTHVSNRM